MPILSLIGSRERHKQGIRYANLLVLIVAMLVIYPLFEERSFGKALLAGFTTLVMGGAAYAVARTRTERIVALCVGLPMVVVTWVAVLHRPPGLIGITFGAQVLFYVVVIVMLLKDILQREEVHADTIYGAICVYLLLGIAWAGVYDVIEVASPGSFQVSDALRVDGKLDWADTTYFSFVTLTTLGYGDISPLSRLAKTMAMLEAVTGVLYTATLIARLVSGHMRGAGARSGESSG